MDMALEKQIDLAKYGGHGEVVIGPQSLRSRTVLKNELAKRTVKVVKDADGNVSTEAKDIDAGDMEILQILSYVRRAPFVPTLDSFFQYCDGLEATKPGASVELATAMQSAVEEVIDNPSPLGS